MPDPTVIDTPAPQAALQALPTPSWTTIRPTQRPAGGFVYKALARIAGAPARLLMVGDGTFTTQAVYALSDDDGQTWTQYDAPYATRTDTALCVLANSEPIMFGGLSAYLADKVYGDAWSFFPPEGASPGSWNPLPGGPPARWGGCLVNVLNDGERYPGIYLFAGATEPNLLPTKLLNDVWVGVNGGMSWQKVAVKQPFTPRYYAAAAHFDGRLWIIGGYDATHQPLNDVWSSADGGVTWVKQAGTPPWGARAGAAAVGLTYHLCLVGGGNGPDSRYLELWLMDANGAWAPGPDPPAEHVLGGVSPEVYNTSIAWFTGGGDGNVWRLAYPPT